MDATRPAAREQLELLAERVGVPYLAGAGSKPEHMAADALKQARLGGNHILILDTAGRQVVDDALMAEIQAVEKAVNTTERLLVLDAMTGQTALEVAETFHKTVKLTGCIMSKTDADMRGGAALSVAFSTGVPVRYVGTGEKLDAFELFDPERMAGRILGQGDIVGLVEKIEATIDKEKQPGQPKKSRKGALI